MSAWLESPPVYLQGVSRIEIVVIAYVDLYMKTCVLLAGRVQKRDCRDCLLDVEDTKELRRGVCACQGSQRCVTYRL